MSIHKASLKGKRPQNEDRHDVILNMDITSPTYDKTKAPINYYAVYDGHGGKFVSNYLHQKLPTVFMDPRMEYPVKKSIVKKLYQYWQNDLRTKYYDQCCQTGSTCCIVIHYRENSGEYLNIINTGDSRAIICRNNIAVPLSSDHKPHMPEESTRIKQLGGNIVFDGVDWRIHDLSVSRAFGDITAEPFVTNMPDIYRYRLTNSDKFIVVACDGLYDYLQNSDIVNFILDNCYDMKTGTRINKHINIAKRLADHAIATGSTDNVSVLVIFFK